MIIELKQVSFLDKMTPICFVLNEKWHSSDFYHKAQEKFLKSKDYLLRKYIWQICSVDKNFSLESEDKLFNYIGKNSFELVKMLNYCGKLIWIIAIKVYFF